MMNLVYIWYGDRYRSKILCSNILDRVCDLKVKVTDFEFLMLILF